MSFTKNISNKYGKQLLDTATKTGLDALKSASKKVVHKAAEAIGEFIGNNIADKIVKPKPVIDANYRKYWRNTYSTREKWRDIEWIKITLQNGALKFYDFTNLGFTT